MTIGKKARKPRQKLYFVVSVKDDGKTWHYFVPEKGNKDEIQLLFWNTRFIKDVMVRTGSKFTETAVDEIVQDENTPYEIFIKLNGKLRAVETLDKFSDKMAKREILVNFDKEKMVSEVCLTDSKEFEDKAFVKMLAYVNRKRYEYYVRINGNEEELAKFVYETQNYTNLDTCEMFVFTKEKIKPEDIPAGSNVLDGEFKYSEVLRRIKRDKKQEFLKDLLFRFGLQEMMNNRNRSFDRL